MERNLDYWRAVFADAKHGHVCWDGNAADPYDPAHAYTSAKRFVDHATYLGFFKPGGQILDLGCGNGRFCIFLSAMDVWYTGIDVMRECVDFCAAAFRDFPRLRFAHADVRNEVSNPSGGVRAEEFRLPFADRQLDDVVVYSVFTHLQTLAAAGHYMDEVRRVLKPGGKFFVTWYRSPPDPEPSEYVGRTVYRESDILTMMRGFSCEYSYGGHTGQFYDQWGMFCTRL